VQNGSLPAGLYALIDSGVAPQLSLTEKAEAVLEGGVRVLQLRMKGVPDGEALAAARAVVARCEGVGALCLINDRVDLALLAGAHGVHLGDHDLPPAEARRLLGPGAVVGVTCRSRAHLDAAAAAGATYGGVGPVFATRTKVVDAPLLGLEGLRERVAGSPLPVVAIGGISLESIAGVASAGAHGAAVAGALLGAPAISAAARRLAEAWRTGLASRV
jgi:thiamine-phosphate pyrophosphorylase